MSEHTGPVCKQCGTEFYYDYLYIEPHEGSGYCWLCFSDWERIRATAQPPAYRETPGEVG